MYSLCLFGVVINLIVDMAPDYQENKNSALHVKKVADPCASTTSQRVALQRVVSL